MEYGQLAIQFVLSDQDDEQNTTASDAAAKLRASPGGAMSWVLSVSQWIHGEDGADDMVARAKAISFLSKTLEHLRGDASPLAAPQINHLVTFFCSLLGSHQAGVLPSTNALASLVSMRHFRPPKAVEILESLAKLGEDFSRQPAATRVVVYRFIGDLVESPPTRDVLVEWSRKGPGFMKTWLGLSRSERDPACLMAWFDVLREFLASYDPGRDLAKEVFAAFSAYFPITVRANQRPSGITGDDLKQALRACFAAHHHVVELSIPFLLGKLDQGEGEGLSSPVRVDILRTLHACIAGCDQPRQGIAPFAEKVWSGLRHEVHNGDEPDAVAVALEAVRTLSARLEGEDLAKYLGRVVADCHDDLTNAARATAAGKLLAVVASAKQATFFPLATKSLDFLARQLRASHTSPQTTELVVALNSILELRTTFPPEVDLPPGSRDISPETIAALYDETYLVLIERSLRDDSTEDGPGLVSKCFRGLGMLARLPRRQTEASESQGLEMCDAICGRLARAILDRGEDPRFEKPVEEAALALATISAVDPGAIRTLVSMALPNAAGSTPALRNNISAVVFVGTKELPAAGDKLDRLVFVVVTLLTSLRDTLDGDGPPGAWTEFAMGILNALTQFRSRYITEDFRAELSLSIFRDDVIGRYSSLPFLVPDDCERFRRCPPGTPRPEWTLESAFFSLCFFVTKQLYRRATLLDAEQRTGRIRVLLSTDFKGRPDRVQAENAYLLAVSRIAAFTLRNVEPGCQLRLGVHQEFFALFRGFDTLNIPGNWGTVWNGKPAMSALVDDLCDSVSYNMRALPRSNLSAGRVAQLSVGIVQGLSPIGTEELWDNHSAHTVFINGLMGQIDKWSYSSPLTNVLLANFANKFEVESKSNYLNMMELQMRAAINGKCMGPAVDSQVSFPKGFAARIALASNVAVIVGGIVRRAKGGSIGALLTTMATAPASPHLGYQLARRLELVMAPGLDDAEGIVVTRPTWKARVYHQLTRPMVDRAVPRPDSTDQEIQESANFRTAVVAMIRHMEPAIYEDDAEDILRVSLCLAGEQPANDDVASALAVIKHVIDVARDKVEAHLGSVIRACETIVRDNAWVRPHWMPDDREFAAPTSPSILRCSTEALQLFGLMPSKYGQEHPHIRGEVATVSRLLANASGLRSRSTREQARLARIAWRDVKP